MKIKRIAAENVHGYLPINVEFFDELTFLTGLNGSGKTSCLRLLMALLTPNLTELGSIVFSKAEVFVDNAGTEIVVRAIKEAGSVSVSISTVIEILEISSSELEISIEAKRRDEARSPVIDRWQSSLVFQRIQQLSTPMFLGLDRRFFAPGVISEDPEDFRRREYLARRYWHDDVATRGAALPASLLDVNYLVVTKVQEIRALQEKLDEKLRTDIFTRAFEYNPSDAFGGSQGVPSRQEIEKYRQQLNRIERAADSVKIPVPGIQAALTHFFEKMSNVVESMEKKRTIKSKKSAGVTLNFDVSYIEWMINKPQADKIVEHLSLLNEYIERRSALRKPIENFLQLVNAFLAQTRKSVALDGSGRLVVHLEGSASDRHITALSSGERQLLVMLAHLSLNKLLEGSGVFIVDEPELSLHIDWQEKFVDAVIEANPNVQMILATHSPAIILDKHENCVSLS